MIGSLRGSVLSISESSALVEVNGVGYLVNATPGTLADLGPVGSDVFVHVYHHIREDAQTLFGFTDADGREVFETLLGAHGVGPTLALAILGVHSPNSLRRIVADEDMASMCLVPGVGKKTAQRLMLELASRLGDTSGVATEPGGQGSAVGDSSALQDVRDALEGLGYSPEEIARTVRQLSSDVDASDGLKQALLILAGG